MKNLKFIFLGNGKKTGVLETAAMLRPEIERFGKIVAADFDGNENITRLKADLAIVFGGDGSILRAVAQLSENQIPVLAVHLGTLSFLSTIQVNDLIPLLQRPDILKLPVLQHLLLNCVHYAASPQSETSTLVVNEVYIQGMGASRLINIDLLIDGETVTTYRGDGLILSTPVGSTAHNLSAGGPILRKDIDAVVISPVSPHTLSNRPLVESPERIFELRTDQPAVLIVDGRQIAKIESDDTVCISRAAQTFKLLDVPGYSYYANLRNKLDWNGCLHKNDEHRSVSR